MDQDEFVRLDAAVSKYLRIISLAPEARQRFEAKAVLNTDVEGATIFYNLLQFFRDYRHLFSIGRTLIPKPDASADVNLLVREMWEGCKHTPPSTAGHVEAWAQARDTKVILEFIQFLKEGDDEWGVSIEGAIHSGTPEELEQRFRKWKQR